MFVPFLVSLFVDSLMSEIVSESPLKPIMAWRQKKIRGNEAEMTTTIGVLIASCNGYNGQ